MDLPTYTNIWRIEKRLYKLYDFRLPMPLPVGTFGVALGVFMLWVVLLSLFRAPFEFGNGWHLVLWVVPPGVITVLATRPVIEGKRLTELLISQARFLTEARVYTRLAPEYEPSEVRVAVRVWHRDPAAGPLPLSREARLVRGEEEDRILQDREAILETVEEPEVSAEEEALRAAREAAPPLRGVSVPEPEPEPVPESAFESDDATEYVPAPKVPAIVGAITESTERHEPTERQESPGRPDAPAAMATTSPPGSEEERPRRGVGRRVLNYFGFALPSSAGTPEHDDRTFGYTGDHDRPREEGSGAHEGGDDFDEPVYVTEEDEQRDRDEWFARLRASSGQTPVGLTSKSAYTSSDTGAMSSDELAAATEPESPAARRLRGRTQGIRVTRDLDARREREVEPTDVTADTEVSDPVERERERVRPPALRTRAKARGLPATDEGPDTEKTSSEDTGTDLSGRRGRPHATPWELDRGKADLSDYAVRYAEATGRPSAARDVSPAPWLPPAAATPQDKPEKRQTAEPAEKPAEEPAEESAEKPTLKPEKKARKRVDEPERSKEAIGRTAAGPQVSHAARPPARDLELDHGTGAQSDHMSVLDRHLVKADTPAPPRPKFADAVPADERPRESSDSSEWFDDGKRRHPDQPKIGDKDNPVIAVSQLKEERRRKEREEAQARSAAEARAEAEEVKPATQLDHGTGELLSFVEVREEPASEPARRTEAELTEAEEAALRARRGEAEQSKPGGSETQERPEPQEAPKAPHASKAPEAHEVSEATETSNTSDPSDAHDGVFNRVADNARRISRMFGQSAPREEADHPEPGLELDHGTGEQDRLGDTPTEEPTTDSGATRGWRRLAKVVTGGAAPMRSDLPPGDIERLRAPLTEPRSLVVLGCTGGAGQTVTALMIGHTLAAHRDDRVVAVDVNPGPNGLSRRVGAQTPETLTALLANADAIDEYEQMRSYAGRAETGLEVVQTLDDPYVQTLDDRDYGQLTELLGSFYGLTLLDPAATGVARALPVTDGLVLVAPASADAERAVSMTFEWLDGNGYAALRANSVLVVNGVSKRSLPDVDAAERVARGRCRAIVRIPWDDHLGASYTKIDVGALRPATKRAHGALGGVLINALDPAPRS